MQTETNTTVASRWYEEVFNAGNLALIDELFAPNFVDHDPSNPHYFGLPLGVIIAGVIAVTAVGITMAKFFL